jgi:hypothetical protein
MKMQANNNRTLLLILLVLLVYVHFFRNNGVAIEPNVINNTRIFYTVNDSLKNTHFENNEKIEKYIDNVDSDSLYYFLKKHYSSNSN